MGAKVAVASFIIAVLLAFLAVFGPAFVEGVRESQECRVTNPNGTWCQLFKED
jgi:hypothetical protein